MKKTLPMLVSLRRRCSPRTRDVRRRAGVAASVRTGAVACATLVSRLPGPTTPSSPRLARPAAPALARGTNMPPNPHRMCLASLYPLPPTNSSTTPRTEAANSGPPSISTQAGHDAPSATCHSDKTACSLQHLPLRIHRPIASGMSWTPPRPPPPARMTTGAINGLRRGGARERGAGL